MATASVTGKHPSGWITISTDEYESMKETIEVLSDIDIIKQLEEGKKDSARARDFESLGFCSNLRILAVFICLHNGKLQHLPHRPHQARCAR